MKTITTTGGVFRCLSDWIEIYHLQVIEGYVSYFDFDGIAYAMDEVIRFGSLWIGESRDHFTDSDGSQCSVIGLATTLYHHPVYIEVHEYGEHIRVYEREREYEVD